MRPVLRRFGVEMVAPLGGRLNQHWHVERNGERLVLRRWVQPLTEIEWEVRLLERVAALGWPVAPVLDGPAEIDGALWSLAPFLPGEPPDTADPTAELRARGRLLAELHADLAQVRGLGQRPPWRRCEEILADGSLDGLLAAHEIADPDEGALLRRHLDRARERVAALDLTDRPTQPIHGDFTTWNLRFVDGKLSGILDFELARDDHRIADFTLAWRGKYDAVVHGYHEVSPLEPVEWELLTPLWWAFLIDSAALLLRAGQRDDGWIARKLRERSPLMESTVL